MTPDATVRYLEVEVRFQPYGQSMITSKESASLPCGCTMYAGVHVATGGRATVVEMCNQPHQLLIARANELVTQSMRQSACRPLVDVCAEMLSRAAQEMMSDSPRLEAILREFADYMVQGALLTEREGVLTAGDGYALQVDHAISQIETLYAHRLPSPDPLPVEPLENDELARRHKRYLGPSDQGQQLVERLRKAQADLAACEARLAEPATTGEDPAAERVRWGRYANVRAHHGPEGKYRVDRLYGIRIPQDGITFHRSSGDAVRAARRWDSDSR